MRFAENHKLHLISDEVYALSTFDNGVGRNTPFTSVLSIDRTDLISDDRLQVFYGMMQGIAHISTSLSPPLSSPDPSHTH